ncbi:hypothetical protein BH10PLA2_BH10PLA2_30590 [soil metagenome]
MLHAEGGYTEFKVEWRPKSVIVHAADLWSSQAMKAMWNPAEAMGVKCQKCGAPMQPRSRKSDGQTYFGCTKFSECNGIKDASALPAIENVFLDWLKRMYPIPETTAASMVPSEELPF